MEEPPKETVIIVHGTWAAPDPVKRRWYQPVDGAPAAEGFVSKLDAALQKRGSPARCWAHCTKGDPIFQWSGENSWIARTHAASVLADNVAAVSKQGWRCHIVAHSHGGNVVVDALPQIVAAVNSKQALGKIVTLGTPFMDTMSRIVTRTEQRYKILRLVSEIALFPVALYFFIAAINTYEYEPGSGAELPSLGFALIGIFFLLPLLARLRHRKGAITSSRTTFTDYEQSRFLIISSPMDEAWQILYHAQSIPDPLAVRSSLLGYLFSSLRSAISESGVIARIHGAKSYADLGKIAKIILAAAHLSTVVFVIWVTWYYFIAGRQAWINLLGEFMPVGLWISTMLVASILFFTMVLGEIFFSAYLSPLRWLAQRLGSLATIWSTIGTYVVRRLGWSVLVKLTMGLEGYRFKNPAIEQRPSTIAKNYIKYENIPESVQERALEKRSAWVARHLGDVSQTFSNLTITAADITSLLRTVEQDQTLVHAAYYTDDECIARIADWIAGKASASEGEADQPLLTKSRITA